EDDRVPARLVLSFVLGAVVISIALSLWGLAATRSAEAAIRPTGTWADRNLEKPPQYSTVVQDLFSPRGEGEALNQRKRRELEEWGWVDRQKGVARIPIEEAMRSVATERAP